MKLFPFLLLALATCLLAPAAAQADGKAGSPAPMATSADCTRQMQRMQELHARITAAGSAAERGKLLAEQRQLMQDMMNAMQGMDMKPGAMNHKDMNHKDMDRNGMMQRMDMMQTMMQGMMDQQAGTAGAP